MSNFVTVEAMKFTCWFLGHRFNIIEFNHDRVYLSDKCERCGKRDYTNAEMYRKYQAYLQLTGVIDENDPARLTWKKKR